ncbi:uncharacterized protein LOC111694458 [Trichogramma pretiosum]|uniref:uncharacterized protein LOC111694458 n=1 Tax=Trichogramma pretiosum TaxID=7493 RepID=UPI000C71C026|nr:uncharacterized protein LOC111694458 [Trichogramma pretiosum]
MKFRESMMESSDILDCNVRVKEEPIHTSIIENDRETIDEKPDLKNFQFLPFQRENSDHIVRKCDVNRENKLDDQVEIIVECEDVKPNINLSTVKKIDDDSQNHSRNIKNSDGSGTQNNIKIETTGEVKQEFLGDAAEDVDLNFDCALFEQNKKRRITKKLNDELNLKTNISKVHNDKAHACKICEKKFSWKSGLLRHHQSSHQSITYQCDF